MRSIKNNLKQRNNKSDPNINTNVFYFQLEKNTRKKRIVWRMQRNGKISSPFKRYYILVKDDSDNVNAIKQKRLLYFKTEISCFSKPFYILFQNRYESNQVI